MILSIHTMWLFPVFATDKTYADIQNPGHSSYDSFLLTFPDLILVQTDRHGGRNMLFQVMLKIHGRLITTFLLGSISVHLNIPIIDY